MCACTPDSCLVNNFANFPDVRVKKNERLHSTVCGISLEQYLQLQKQKQKNKNKKTKTKQKQTKNITVF